MSWKSLLSLVVLAAPQAQALIRFPCSQLVTERTDPLVMPGIVSPHVHQVIGGDAFNITMPLENDLPKLSSCTTCKFKADKSNYWTAVLYFKHPNGTFIRVPQKANHLVGNPNGGMTIYYIQPPNRNTKVTSFPKGFRMLAGDPFLRQRKPGLDLNSPEAYFSSFRCWQTSGFTDPSNSSPPGAGNYDTVTLPPKPCPAGIRSHIFFPSCWDGKNVDSPDHKSHVAYMQGRVDKNSGIILMDGTCPSTHPVRIPMLFYETAWDTTPFNNMWPSDGSQPFVLSMGDPTGYGHHGDYVFGWEGDSLQRAMDSCYDTFGAPESCTLLAQVSDNDMNQCRKASVVDERVEGQCRTFLFFHSPRKQVLHANTHFLDLPALPGCNPIQSGPNPATVVPNCNAISTTINGPSQTQPPTSPTPTQPPVSSPTPTPNPTQPPAPQQTHWGQCGGQGYSGPTVCEAPFTCQAQNQWYSQCL
ncbi:hypothetical protein BXZ70DRAFT_690680 [Cristinia sonorae]|uniref:CBM1 domain-containing protein n=1 Tax=Cristinia sonorae TaxID=1940300 RepID=A0A8K0XJY1_9AGAR|nr:hypothetical protein BXZ70DRAFT_690680 [Cristinia sonorae]